jgi:Mg2+ and Co2+ transporter CorA
MIVNLRSRRLRPVSIDEIGAVVQAGSGRLYADLSGEPRSRFIETIATLGLSERIGASVRRAHAGLTVASAGKGAREWAAYLVLRSAGNHRAEILFTPDAVIVRREGREGGFHYAFGEAPDERLNELLTRGTDQVAYTLVDALADSFDPALDRAAEALEAIEEQLVRGDAGALEVLLDHKRELLALRVRVSILREAVNGLLGYEKTLITPEGMGYWRDLYGSIARVGELAEASSDQASMALDLHLTAVNNALSVTMKRLTGITAVLALAGALAGLFGMSEAGLAFAGSEASGFWAISGLIVSICAAVALGLRRSRWI